VALKENRNASVNELMQFLGARLPAYMLPVIALVEAFPLLPNGKIDTASLVQTNVENDTPPGEYVTPRNANEQLLAEIWAQVLNLEQVSIHDNFFQAGGASLQVIQVVNKAKEQGMQLTAELLFRYQTIALLAEHVTVEHHIKKEEEKAQGQVAQLGLTSTPAMLPKPEIAHAQMVIESLGVYLPEKTVSTKEVLDGCRHCIDFPLERLTGIKTRQVAAINEFSIDLAIKAVEKCLSASKYHADDIDVVICCNISRAFNFCPPEKTFWSCQRHHL
jgi:aryl carrier-like protein